MSKKDTTKTGVSNDKPADDYIADQGALDRDEDVGDIVANAKIARQLEAAGVDMKNPMEVSLAKEKLAKGEDPNPNAGKPDPGEEDELDPAVNEGDDQDAAGPEMVLAKVNGVEKMVLKADVDAEGGIVAYQKARAADEKMRQAAEIRKEYERKERELAERELAFSQQQGASLNKEQNNTGEPSTDVRQLSKEAIALAGKMYSGDETQAAQAIEEILERVNNSTQSLSREQIIEEAAAKVQWQSDLKSAHAMFASEYSDINNVPEYRSYANQATISIRAEHQDWTPSQIIKAAGEQARLKFGDAIRENGKQAGLDDRVARKRATDNVTGNSAKQPQAAPKKAKSQKEIIADMQKNRSHSSI